MQDEEVRTGEETAADAAPDGAAGVDELAAAQQARAELEDKNLRLMAELRNTVQRAAREREESLRYAEADFARELLIVLDDLERTLAAAGDARSDDPLLSGVRLVYEQFLKVLRARHIEPIVAVGEPFDPALHEAMLQQPSTEHPAGTVMQELARGYTMHSRVIRPTRVIVSSGPPAPAEPGSVKG